MDSRKRKDVSRLDAATMSPLAQLLVYGDVRNVSVPAEEWRALLDVAEAARAAAEEVPDVFHSEADQVLSAALDRLEEVRHGSR